MMKHTQYTKSTKFAGKNTAKTPAFKKGYSYSDYWMNDRWSTAGNKFSGLGDASKSNDIVKLIKLSNYRRAITNFVKILTNREIPVLWSGNNSYTDGKSINISTDIKENSFDVTVGLALHEASHVVLTDFDILREIWNGDCIGVNNFIAKYELNNNLGNVTNHKLCPNPLKTIKNLLNWVEDRRIDNYIFKTSPGYKAYYHKLYDYYWNDKSIVKGLHSKDYRTMKMDSYMFHIINMVSPGYNPKALPGLDTITKLIDLPNIGRLNNTQEALELSLQVLTVVMDELIKASQKLVQVTDEEEDTDFGNADSKSNSVEPGDTEDGDNEELEDLTTSERSIIEAAIRKQEKFLNGETGKKSATKTLQKKLDAVATQDIDTQDVGQGRHRYTALMVDLTKASDIERYVNHKDLTDNLRKEFNQMGTTAERRKEITLQQSELDRLNTILQDYVPQGIKRYEKEVEDGFNMGALLGKKLLLHNETRERVDVRLQNGKIDSKRLAHAGYGIENIFKQVNISQHRKANLHISLDISASMSGSKWEQTVKMTAAIVKAISYTQGINVQVGLRTTTAGGRSANPLHMLAYDSRKNNLQHFRTLFSRLTPMDTTPEGLCFEALIKKNMLMKGTNQMDSYFLNLSDGEPYINGSNDYQGQTAIEHTRAQVTKMRTQLNMKVLSFFITGSEYVRENFETSPIGQQFKQMYGNGATVVNSNSALAIAKEMNAKFMQS